MRTSLERRVLSWLQVNNIVTVTNLPKILQISFDHRLCYLATKPLFSLSSLCNPNIAERKIEKIKKKKKKGRKKVLYKNNFIRTLRLKFFQKQGQFKNIKNVFTCAVFLLCIKKEISFEVLRNSLP